MKTKLRPIELLAPARDAQVALAAIAHGADAVYLGPASHGARAQAGNSTADIARVCDVAHQFGVQVYATVNTLVYDDELRQVERLITDLYHAGVDALIVQDMSVLRLDIPPIGLHSSTQCDLRTPEKAKFLSAVGFSQLVMARELSAGEIAAIHAAVPGVPLEGFIHGALCVSYSGRCQVSQAVKGRSANRGECAQMCRLAWDLEDHDRRKLLAGKHLLSLRDFNATAHVEQLLAAGQSSFKIEGRLKDEAYVKNVVAHYRQVLDRAIAAHPDLYCRLSHGTSLVDFEPAVAKSFNRSFTSYFVGGRRPANGTQMASIDTPKSLGEEVGTVLSAHRNVLRVKSAARLANGDGLSYFNGQGEFTGFRVNRVQGNEVLLKEPVAVPAGTKLYRTHDQEFEQRLAKDTAVRTVAVEARLATAPGLLVLHLSDERGNRIAHSVPCPELQPANQPQHERQHAALAKLGGTIYRLKSAQVLGDLFVPASLLTQLRREAIALLDRAQLVTYQRPRRKPEDRSAQCYTTTLESADNVANRVAEQFYRDHGVTSITPAIETGHHADGPVMHTRYCIRRQLGACRLDRQARQLPAPLYLRNGSTRLRVECDCHACEMKLWLDND